MGYQNITNNNNNLSSRHKDVPYKGQWKTKVWSALLDVAKVNESKPVAAAADSVGRDTGPEGGAFDFEW
jgi:hypothetical protein